MAGGRKQPRRDRVGRCIFLTISEDNPHALSVTNNAPLGVYVVENEGVWYLNQKVPGLTFPMGEVRKFPPNTPPFGCLAVFDRDELSDLDLNQALVDAVLELLKNNPAHHLGKSSF